MQALHSSSLVSCIIPIFNGERYLREALDSIVAQTYRPLEIIIADDGSTDGTANLVANYNAQIHYIRQENAGPAAARNLGVSISQGEFVAFLDADDLWHPDKLTQQMARFQARPELALSLVHVQNFWSPEFPEQVARFAEHPLSRPFPGYTTTALLARRAIFDTVGLFNVGLQHENEKDWFIRTEEHGARIEVLPDILVRRRLHETNMSHTKSVTSREERLQLVKTVLERRRQSDSTSSGQRLSSLTQLGQNKEK